MKATRNTPDQLILENNPIWLVVFINAFALIFIAVGLFMLPDELLIGIAFTLGGLLIAVAFNLAFARRTQLILDRPANRIELRRRSLLAYYRQIWTIEDVTGATVQTSMSGDSPTHRAALNVHIYGRDEVHPVTLVYTSGSGPAQAVTLINDWLNQTRP